MNLVPLYEQAIQFNDYNGTVLAAGKVEVWYLGRTRKADIYADVAGETPLPNPLDLNDLGMQEVYVNPAFNYTLVVYDPYGSELFSVDKYLQGAGAHTTSNVVVQPSEHIGVSAWTVGEVQIYQPYLTGQLGKVYTGIEPIVVNNVEDKISAQHVPLGVQDPLYFVQDDEEACIIGIDSSACGKTYSGISPILVDNTANTISITGDIGKDWTEEILSAANDASAAATAWTNSQGYLTGVDLSEYAKTDFVVSSIDAATSGKYDTSSFSAISASFLTALPPDVVYSADITGLATTAQLNEKLDKSDSANFYPMTANPSGYLTAHQSLQGYATEQWVQNQGYLTSVDIPESANWNSTYNTVHDNSGSWTGGGVTGDFELSAGSGISIVDYPLEQKTVISVTAQGGNPEVEQAVIDNSATWDSVTSKADVTAIPSTAGLATEDWVTGQGYITNDAITGKQDITGMTAYQPVGNYQTAGDYLTTADSANFYTTANESGFVTSGELPDPITIGVQEGDTLDTDYDGLKIVKATANGNEHINLHKKSTDQWLIHGNLVPTSPGSNKYLVTDDSGAMHWDNKSALAYDSAFEQSGGYITAYNGSAFKAGDELPSGVMNESALEYNAVNEISGYNGSAIAQYGAEKQFIVHDDTLCHLSNSAQFALGVNLSAVAQLLGVDETVLYSGNIQYNATAALNEPAINFDRIRIYWAGENGDKSISVNETQVLSGINMLGIGGLYKRYTSNNKWNFGGFSLSGNSDWSQIKMDANYRYNITGNSIIDYGLNASNFAYIKEIVGIGRKEV